MKPQISYAEFQQAREQWMSAFEKIKALPEGTTLSKYELAWVHEDPHWVQLAYREDGKRLKRMVRRGDVLLIELASAL